MPDRRTHRGPHPEDASLFDRGKLSILARAADDLYWLFSRGYAADSSIKLVGDRYALVARQRVAFARCSCSDADADLGTILPGPVISKHVPNAWIIDLLHTPL